MTNTYYQTLPPVTVISYSTLTVIQVVPITTTVIANYPSAPIPTYTSSSGAIIGKIKHGDGSPAYMYSVVLFVNVQGVLITYSTASAYTDQNGYYVFNDMAPGQYQIYASAQIIQSYSGMTPNAIVVVQANSITAAPDITLG
jgi:hypothetical protein